MRAAMSLAFAMIVGGSVFCGQSIGSAEPPPAGKFQALPAEPEPPEMLAERRHVQQALQSISQGRLNPLQKRQLLLNHPNAAIRAKAQEAQRMKGQPHGSLDMPRPLAALSSLWTLLNPFAVSEADAQTPFAITWTPAIRFTVNPISYTHFRNFSSFGDYESGTVSYHFGSSAQAPTGQGVPSPSVFVYFNVPSDGWYLIDVYGYGKPKATLRKGTSPYTVLEAWDMSTSPTFLNHFVTAEYLARGGHNIYFKLESGGLYFYEMSVESF